MEDVLRFMRLIPQPWPMSFYWELWLPAKRALDQED